MHYDCFAAPRAKSVASMPSARGKKEDPPPPMGPGSRLVSLPKFMKKFVFFNGVRLDPELKKIEGKKLVFNFTTASFKVSAKCGAITNNFISCYFIHTYIRLCFNITLKNL